MTYRVAHLTAKGGHAAQDWPTESLAYADYDRLRHRDDVIVAILVNQDTNKIRLRYASESASHWPEYDPSTDQPSTDEVKP